MNKLFNLMIIIIIALCIMVGCSDRNMSATSNFEETNIAMDNSLEHETILESSTSFNSIGNSNETMSSIENDSKGETVNSNETTSLGANDKKEENDMIISSSQPENEQMKNNCKLIVRDKDITNGNYIFLNDEKSEAEIPLIAIAKELGAEVTWNNEMSITISFNNKNFVLDLSKQDFGIALPPGSKLCVRKVIEKEVVIDGNSARGLIRWMDANINVNCDDRTVEIR